jgi:outer membrane protein assembly factor BamB
VVATSQTSGRSATADIYISNSWNDSGYNAAHTGFEPNDPTLLDAVAPGPPSFLNAVWSDPTGAAVRTSVAIAKDIAYFGNDAGQVSAVDVRNGQPIWTVSEPSVVDSSPALAGSRVFFGINGSSGTGAAVVALNQADGSQAWSAPTSSAVESAPAVANGHVLVGSDDGTVYDLSQTNGTVVWTAHLPGAVTDSPAVDPAAGVVVVGDGSGEVTALSYRTGKVVWQVATGAAVTASPSIFNGTVYIGSGSNNVYALSEATGHQVWVTPTSGAVTSGAIYASFERPNYYAVGCQDGTVWLLGLGDGSVHRVTTVGGPVVGLAASVGWITVTSSNGQLWGLKRNAEPIWKVTAPAPYATAPTLVNGIVYTAGTDQTVTAYSVPGRPIP